MNRLEREAAALGATLAAPSGVLRVQYFTVLATGTGTVTLDAGDGSEIPDVPHLSAYQPVVGDMARVEITGEAWVATDSVYSAARSPKRPWREFADFKTLTIAAGGTGSGSVPVSFPVGLFTTDPVGWVTVLGGSGSSQTTAQWAAPPTASGGNLIASSTVGAIALGATIYVNYGGTQMTPTSGAG